MSTNRRTLFTLLILLAFYNIKAEAFQEPITVYGKIDRASKKYVQLNSETAELDKSGNFVIQVPKEKQKLLVFEYSNIKLDIFGKPGDTIAIFFDETQLEKTLNFNGDHKEIQTFLFGQKEVGESFNSYFNKNINRYLSKLSENRFLQKMDSLQNTFLHPLDELKKNKPHLDSGFTENYRTDIRLLFLSFLADYPLLHLKNTGEKIQLSKASQKRIDAVDLTNPELYDYSGYQRLLHNYLYNAINKELKDPKYALADNQRLNAGFSVILKNFGNTPIYERILFKYFRNHIENLGIKNIHANYDYFMNNISDDAFKEEIRNLYENERLRRKDHLIVPYKEVDGYSLDAHIFQPDSLKEGKQYPVIAMFHGGSFFEGKPDWFFSTAKAYAKKGWIVIAVEYRVADRHGNTLPEAISDGKSLVRFLRTSAEKFQIDPGKIMVTGNSSGATIALSLATTGKLLDEKNENLHISSRPNAVIVNAGLADLKEAGHWWQENYSDNFINKISPINNTEQDLPPILIFHGTKDNSVDINSIRQFAKKAKEEGNDIRFFELKGAPHMIWRIPYFSQKMMEPKREFFQHLNW